MAPGGAGEAWRFALVLSLLVASTASAQMNPPSVRSVRPVGIVPGVPSTIEVRGTGLAGASGVRFDDLDGAKAEVLESSDDRVKIKVTPPKETPPGPRLLRVVTPKGLSDPARVVVTRPIPAVVEKGNHAGFRSAQVIESPCTVEGVLSNGDEVDVYAVEMQAGQTLVAEAFAARAGSGLDALVTISSPEGREIASDDDLFGRDAAAWATLPRSGRYFVQVQDANGRNNDGMIEGRTTREYLLTIGDVPLVVSAYPAGARRGEETRFDLIGVNLPEGLQYRTTFPVEVPAGDARLAVVAPKGAANPLTIRLGDGPELVEPDPEPADDPLRPTPAVVPGSINGRFAAIDEGDADYYRLVPRPGFEGDYAITAYAARVGSPADPVLAVVDPRGASQAEDDDKLGRDARLERRIDAEGLTIAVREAFGRGGPRFVYRVEVEPIRARRVRVTADLGGRTIPRSGSIALPIALERQGEDGPITVLAGELPEGVTAAPTTIPAGGKGGILVLTASASAPIGPFPFRLATRDAAGGPEFVYHERGGPRPPPRPGMTANARADAPSSVDRPFLSIAEPAALGVAIGPDEVTARPGGEVEVKVRLDRRTDAARGPIRVRLIAGDGGLDGVEGAGEVTVPPERSDTLFRLKARPGATPRRATLTARAWFAKASEEQAVDARPAALNVRPGS